MHQLENSFGSGTNFHISLMSLRCSYTKFWYHSSLKLRKVILTMPLQNCTGKTGMHKGCFLSKNLNLNQRVFNKWVNFRNNRRDNGQTDGQTGRRADEKTEKQRIGRSQRRAIGRRAGKQRADVNELSACSLSTKGTVVANRCPCAATSNHTVTASACPWMARSVMARTTCWRILGVGGATRDSTFGGESTDS